MTQAALWAGLGLTALTLGCVPDTGGAPVAAPAAALPPAEAPASADISAAGQQINAYRSESGLPPVAQSPALAQAAQAHLRDMAANGIFSHTGSDGSDPSQRAQRAGCKGPLYVAENIAQGQRNLAEVMASWKASRGHDENLLRATNRLYGMASDGHSWVLVFAQSC